MGLQPIDEGQKKAAIEPVPVEIVRGHIGGCHEDDALGKKRVEQP